MNKAGEQNNQRQSRLDELVEKVKRLESEIGTLERDKQEAQERIQKVYLYTNTEIQDLMMAFRMHPIDLDYKNWRRQ